MRLVSTQLSRISDDPLFWHARVKHCPAHSKTKMSDEGETTTKRTRGEKSKASKKSRTTTSEEGKKRRQRRDQQVPSSLSTRPNVKSYIRQVGSDYTFPTRDGLGKVSRSSAGAVETIYALARENNKEARAVVLIAVAIAHTSKHKTVKTNHVEAAKKILMTVRDGRFN